MRKKLVIDNKEYEICSNAFTLFMYKKEFKTGIMEDVSKLNELNIKQLEVARKSKEEGKSEEEIEALTSNALLTDLDNIIIVVLQLAYIFIKSANPNFMSFEEFTQTIENINLDDGWIAEVTEMAVDTFCGQRTTRTDETHKE